MLTTILSAVAGLGTFGALAGGVIAEVIGTDVAVGTAWGTVAGAGTGLLAAVADLAEEAEEAIFN